MRAGATSGWSGRVGSAAVALLLLGLPAAAIGADLEIRVLSNRADLLSGGDALVEIDPPPAAGSSIDLDGDDVAGDFALRANGRFQGLVTGLAVGDNVLTVLQPDATGATLTLENHPPEGPVFSGPHLQPWDCTTEAEGLGPALDADCNLDPLVEYFYVPTSGGGYVAYDLADPPGDVGLVTNDQGDTVRNIVRRETGAVDRGIYAFAVLHDPAIAPEPIPWDPQAGWNGKLYYPFGASCNTNHTQGTTPGVLDQAQLEDGFAVATSSLNVLGHHCNPVLSAEAAMMTKEILIERLGPIWYTMSTGGSGGAIGQLQVTNAYPGITNGLIPSQMFADVWSTAMEVGDCLLTELYWAKAAESYTLFQKMAVDGHGPPQSSCAAWVALFVPSAIPTTGCFSGSTLPAASVPESRDYNPVTNPEGCRATVQDIQKNVWGLRESDGFAKRAIDNVGVQYGLEALNLPPGDPGKITFAQFLHMNLLIGGADIDGLPTQDRTRADPGTMEIIFRTGMINDGAGLATAAIINQAADLNVEIHTPYHAYAMEQRLLATNGHADNHAIWHFGPGDTAFDTMDDWLTAIYSDESDTPLAEKVVAHKPALAVDSCWSGSDQGPLEDCAGDVFGDARLKAGMPASHDVPKCVLRPVDLVDYAGAEIPVTEELLPLLELAFPEGVCDYDQPSDGRTPSVQWLTYENGPGGEPLGPPPVSMPLPEPGAALGLAAGALLLAVLRRRSLRAVG